MNILALIPARGGSKGIPHKNIQPLAGRPLIAWSIEAALEAQSVSRVIVSTDDEKIAQTACHYGGEVPFLRPAELAGDAILTIDVVLHTLGWLVENRQTIPDYMLVLQPTSPLRTSEDIEAAIRLGLSKNAAAVVSVCEANPHPYLCKRILEDGTLQDFVSAERQYLRRQDMPDAYALNGAIYLNRTENLLAEKTLHPRHALAYVMPVERSLDIDTGWDMHLADLILRDIYNVHED